MAKEMAQVVNIAKRQMSKTENDSKRTQEMAKEMAQATNE